MRTLLFASTMLASISTAQAANITVRDDYASNGTLVSVVKIKGDIEKGDYDYFKRIPMYDKVYVALESNGGIATEGYAIGSIIRRLGFDTVVYKNRICASACAAIWLAGKTRWVGPPLTMPAVGYGAAIGFHAVSEASGAPSLGGNAVYGAYLRDLGLSIKAIRYLSEVPPNQMEWLSVETAHAYEINFRFLSK
jgi:hypothetical protein